MNLWIEILIQNSNKILKVNWNLTSVIDSTTIFRTWNSTSDDFLYGFSYNDSYIYYIQNWIEDLYDHSYIIILT